MDLFKISKIEEEEGLRSHCVVSNGMQYHTLTIPYPENHTIKNEKGI